MRLDIRGLTELRERLERLRSEEVMARALAEQAERVAEAVREGLSDPPGGGEHDRPWLQSGNLRDSIGAQSDGLNAAVGSSDPAAAPQEMGTSRMPPRPFLAPVATSMGEEVARGVAEAVVAALKGDQTNNDFDPHGVQLAAGGNPRGMMRLNELAGRFWGRILPPTNKPAAPGSEPGGPPAATAAPPKPTTAERNEKLSSSPTNLAKPGEASLAEDRRLYILDGNGRGGGGHGPGRATPGKSTFPSDWSDEKVIDSIRSVANDPSLVRMPADGGRTSVEGTRDGVNIRVIIGRDGKAIVTAYPTNIEPNGP